MLKIFRKVQNEFMYSYLRVLQAISNGSPFLRKVRNNGFQQFLHDNNNNPFSDS